ncbi:MAG: hypothetical protein P8J27_08245 [Mariniblastus sp.]|nr:hypothetical protein [Mariniblastus sp.]
MIFGPYDWQTCVALLIVLGAIGILARRLGSMLWGGKLSGCGTSCDHCPASKSPSPTSLKMTQLVQLETPQEDSDFGNPVS